MPTAKVAALRNVLHHRCSRQCSRLCVRIQVSGSYCTEESITAQRVRSHDLSGAQQELHVHGGAAASVLIRVALTRLESARVAMTELGSYFLLSVPGGTRASDDHPG